MRSSPTRQPARMPSGKRSSRSVRLPSIQNAPRRSIVSRSSSLKGATPQRRVQRDAELILEECLWHLCGENAEDTMKKLVDIVAIRRGGVHTPKKGKPLWQRVQAIVVIANQEGIRRMYAAVSSESVSFFFDQSLRMLEIPKKKALRKPPDEFATFPSLRKYLIGATLNNKAFMQHASGDSVYAVAQTLLSALHEVGVAFSTVTVYNLAVLMVSVQRFDLVSEFIACCSELVEVCLRLDMSGCSGVMPIFEEYRKNIAKHAIMCHHLVAALAAWCRLRDVELYHCQLAVCCAQRFLDPKGVLATRCKQRLVACKDGTSTLMMSAETPPRLSMLTDDLSLVTDPLFILFLERAEKAQAPSRFANCVAKLAVRGRSPDLHHANGHLPPIKRKAPSSLGRKQSSPSLSPTRKQTPDHKRASRPSSSRMSVAGGQRGSRRASKAGPSDITRSLIETFKSERAASTTATKDGPVFSLDFFSHLEEPHLITFMPKPAFHCYKHLRREMRHLMSEIGSNQSYALTGSTDMMTSQDSQQKVLAHESIISETRVNSPPPKTYMLIMDKKLRVLSKLIPDEEFEKKEFAVVVIQSFWRGVVVRREYRRLLSELRETLFRREAAEIIQRAYRNHSATREDIAKKKELRAHRFVVQLVTLVQSYLYEKQSVEESGRKTVLALKRRLAELLEAIRRNKSAIRLQSFWRMCSVWIHMNRCVAAACTIQRVLRGHWGRMRARERRVSVRLAEQERIAWQTLHIRPIQLWWKDILLLRSCKSLLASKQRDVAAYLGEQEGKFNAEWERFKHIPNVELCVMKIFSVLRGYHSRVELGYKYKCVSTIRRFLLCVIWKKREQLRLQSLREERGQLRLLRRRREDVMDAALRIQCAVRRWLACRHRDVLWLRLQRLHHHARLIQHAYRRHVGRRLLHAAREEGRRKEERRMMAQQMHYSAAKIQATWRMYTERRAQADYLQFLRWDRHVYSARIQRAWQAYRARCEVQWMRSNRSGAQRHLQKEHYLLMAAIRIQSTVRMFLERQRLLRNNVKLRPTPAWLHYCARRIQCAWRRYAAYEYVQQLRFSRAYYDQQKINEEALHTYAAMIQSLVRAKILNPRLVEARLIEVEHEDPEFKKKREKAYEVYDAAIAKQRQMRQTKKRTRKSSMLIVTRLVAAEECEPTLPRYLATEECAPSLPRYLATEECSPVPPLEITELEEPADGGRKMSLEECAPSLPRYLATEECAPSLPRYLATEECAPTLPRYLATEECSPVPPLEITELEEPADGGRKMSLEECAPSLPRYLATEECAPTLPRYLATEECAPTLPRYLATEECAPSLPRYLATEECAPSLPRYLATEECAPTLPRYLATEECAPSLPRYLATEECAPSLPRYLATEECAPSLPRYLATEECAPSLPRYLATEECAPSLPRYLATEECAPSLPRYLATEECSPVPPLEITELEEPADGGRKMSLEECALLLQRYCRGGMERRRLFEILKEHPRWKAAVEIQRIWRGYSSRQLVEIYYEFYMEEVEETEGDEEDDDDTQNGTDASEDY